MLTISVHTLDLNGTSYEIGYKLGNIISENTAHKIAYTRKLEGFGLTEYKDGAIYGGRWHRSGFI